MSQKRNRSSGYVLLLVIFVLIGALILWLGVPYFAESQYGAPTAYLTGFSRWNYSFQIIKGRQSLSEPVSITPIEKVFEIQPGESVTSIATRLEAQGLIKDAGSFRAYLIYKGLDAWIKAGTFKLSPSMSGVEIASAIQSTYTQSVPFYIYPGWRAEEIAAALPTSGIEVSPDEFLRLVHNPHTLSSTSIISNFPSAEGFLFPGEYEIDREITAEGLLITFTNRFNISVGSDIISAIENQGLTLYEGITLASIIQRETFEDQERAKIASVFYNRLQNGMKLETDPTVQYSLGYSDTWGGWWKTPLSLEDLDFNSSFNTYQNTGLPPAPISNPDLPAIMAVAYPDQTPYLYFRAMCDDSGLHDFSVTFAEHLSKACQ